MWLDSIWMTRLKNLFQSNLMQCNLDRCLDIQIIIYLLILILHNVSNRLKVKLVKLN
jgi:hypothetical protein